LGVRKRRCSLSSISSLFISLLSSLFISLSIQLLSPVIERILFNINADSTTESLSQMIPMKTSLARFDARVRELVVVVENLLADDTYLNNMYISYRVSTGMRREGKRKNEEMKKKKKKKKKEKERNAMNQNSFSSLKVTTMWSWK
jgi:hypothetical protein